MDNPSEPMWLNQKPVSPPSPPPPPESAADKLKPPPPPPPEITIRTMKSDLEYLKEGGGSATAPKSFTPPELKRGVISSSYQPPTPPPPAPPRITPSEFGEPQKTELPKPETPKSPVIEEEKSSNNLSKKLLIWFGASIIVIGLGALGYFVIFPKLFPKQTPPPPPPAVTQPIPPAEPTPPPAEQTPLPETPKPHQSLLKSPNATTSIEIPTIDLISLVGAMQQEAQESLPADTLKEILLTTGKIQVQSSAALSVLLPDLDTEKTKDLFENDFTIALYSDANGTWPIYIFKLSLESSIVEAQATVKEFEKSSGLANFFLAAPGTPNSAGFKDGKINEISTRYLTYSNKGAGLNLAWAGDKFIISASYNGLKKTLGNLTQ